MCDKSQFEEWLRAIEFREGMTELDGLRELLTQAHNHVRTNFSEEFRKARELLKVADFYENCIGMSRGNTFPHLEAELKSASGGGID